ncbi:hypothetical protein D1007_28748 [Hordeum vulgare]|nr:hypothetical protein D1007_28748 [Hordeum vulgare]
MNRLLRRSRSTDLAAAANLPPLAPLAAVPPAPAAPGPPRAPDVPAVPLGHDTLDAPTAADAAPFADRLHRGVGHALVPALDIPDAPAPALADGLPVTITHLLRFKLDLAVGNYSKWRHLFYCILCKYNVRYHVDEEHDPLLQDAVWRNDDITIILWIYSTISDEFYAIVVSPASTVRRVWHTLLLLFLDNQAGRALLLSAEFRSTVQGNLTIAEYACRLQSLAAALDDVDEPITDHTLTLQFINGLSRRFHVLAMVLPMQVPFPNFVQARSRLLLEEITQNERARADGRSDDATTLSIGTTPDGSSGGRDLTASSPATRRTRGSPLPSPPPAATVAVAVGVVVVVAATTRAATPLLLGTAPLINHSARTRGWVTSPRETMGDIEVYHRDPTVRCLDPLFDPFCMCVNEVSLNIT